MSDTATANDRGSDRKAPGTTKVNEAPPGFRGDVQGLRAIAVVLVVVFHSGFGLSGGFLGVDVFFVISGFVIGRLLVHELVTTGRIDFSGFYSRRVRRLLPAMAFVLVVVAIGSVLIINPTSDLRQTTTRVGIASALFSANFALLWSTDTGYFDLSSAWNPLLHMWTLALEEQFYLVLPALLAVTFRLGRRHDRRAGLRRIAVGCALVAGVSLFAGLWVVGSHGFPGGSIEQNRDAAFYLLPTRAWQFLAGVALVFVERSRFTLDGWKAQTLSLAGIATILWTAVHATGEAPTPGSFAILAVIGTAAVLVGAGAPTTITARALSIRPAKWIGDRSYGWYLWHWPAIVFTHMSIPTASPALLLAVGTAALIPTELSYRFLETPIRFNRTWRGRRAVKLGVISCAVSLMAFGAATVGHRITSDVHLPGNPERAHLDREVGCARLLPDDPLVAERCSWQADGSNGRIVLIGDSQAGAFSEVIRDRVLAAGYDFTLATFDACPFNTGGIAKPDSPCSHWIDTWTAELTEHPPALIIVANRGAKTVYDERYSLPDPESGRRVHDESTKAAIWRRTMTRTLTDLEATNSPVAVIATVPLFGDFDTRACATWQVLFAPRLCSVTTTRAATDTERAGYLAAEQAAVDATDTAHLVDFIDEICTRRTCSTLDGDTWRYRDGSHLSIEGAAQLGPAIDEMVIPLARPHPTRS